MSRRGAGQRGRGGDDEPANGADGDGPAPVAEALSPKQEAALAALLNQPTVKRAADACGVPERTLYRWLDEDAAFKRAYRRARRQAFNHAVSLAQQGAAAAVSTLLRMLGDPACTHAARVAAAAHVLKFGRESIELDELVGRVEELEQASREQQQQNQESGSWRRG